MFAKHDNASSIKDIMKEIDLMKNMKDININKWNNLHYELGKLASKDIESANDKIILMCLLGFVSEHDNERALGIIEDLKNIKIGQRHSLFYSFESLAYERLNNFVQALYVFQEGFKNKVEPHQFLVLSFEKFKDRMRSLLNKVDHVELGVCNGLIYTYNNGLVCTNSSGRPANPEIDFLSMLDPQKPTAAFAYNQSNFYSKIDQSSVFMVSDTVKHRSNNLLHETNLKRENSLGRITFQNEYFQKQLYATGSDSSTDNNSTGKSDEPKSILRKSRGSILRNGADKSNSIVAYESTNSLFEDVQFIGDTEGKQDDYVRSPKINEDISITSYNDQSIKDMNINSKDLSSNDYAKHGESGDGERKSSFRQPIKFQDERPLQVLKQTYHLDDDRDSVPMTIFTKNSNSTQPNASSSSADRDHNKRISVLEETDAESPSMSPNPIYRLPQKRKKRPDNIIQALKTGIKMPLPNFDQKEDGDHPVIFNQHEVKTRQRIDTMIPQRGIDGSSSSKLVIGESISILGKMYKITDVKNSNLYICENLYIVKPLSSFVVDINPPNPQNFVLRIKEVNDYYVAQYLTNGSMTDILTEVHKSKYINEYTCLFFLFNMVNILIGLESCGCIHDNINESTLLVNIPNKVLTPFENNDVWNQAGVCLCSCDKIRKNLNTKVDRISVLSIFYYMCTRQNFDNIHHQPPKRWNPGIWNLAFETLLAGLDLHKLKEELINLLVANGTSVKSQISRIFVSIQQK